VTTPTTTDANTNKINPSSATDLKSPDSVVGVGTTVNNWRPPITTAQLSG
jgi:hypothetical protein